MPVATMLGVANSTFTLTAGGALDIGSVYSPTYLPVPWFWGTDGKSFLSDFYQFSADSGVSLTAAGGDVTVKSFETYLNTTLFISPTSGFARQEQIQFYQSFVDLGRVWPASLTAHAASGAINFSTKGTPMELYPSPTGQFELIAERDVKLASTQQSAVYLTDKNPYLLPSAVAPKPDGVTFFNWRNGNLAIAFDYNVGFDPGFIPDYDFHVTHIEDPDPVRLYSRTGDINDVGGQVPLRLAKSARVRAGRDLIDLPVWAQNVRDDDLTSVIAGRDMYGTLLGRVKAQANASTSLPTGTMSVIVGGPGTVYVEAGRNIGPLMLAGGALPGGIVATGPATNRFLPRESADVYVVFGVANGMDSEAMITRYFDPASAGAASHNYLPELVAYLSELHRQHGGAAQNLTAVEAIAEFRSLPMVQQRTFLYQVLFAELQTAADPIRNPENFKKYDRSYGAIQTLFPPEPRLSRHRRQGHEGTAARSICATPPSRPSSAATFRSWRRSAASSSAASRRRPCPTTRRGSAFSRCEAATSASSRSVDVLVNQSRIFTEQGGDILMWSSNGDLNAGKGAKTSAFYPPLLRATSIDGYSSIDPAGLVTGAGIGALQTIVGQPASDVYLIAPHGTVDAGDAGLRATGNLNIAALRVLNADNIKVGGTVTGIPCSTATRPP